MLIFCRAFILKVVDEANKESCPAKCEQVVTMMTICEIEIRDDMLDFIRHTF